MELLAAWAPRSLAESWDNPGLLVGDADREVKRVLVALDVRDSVIEEAILCRADWIITHHPMLFSPLKKITTDSPNGRRVLRLAQAGISHYAMHTNLDTAFGGTNDTLAALANLQEVSVLCPTCQQDGQPNGLGRIGFLPEPMALGEFADMLRQKVGLRHISIVGSREKQVRRVALCTGSGMDFLEEAANQGADVYLSGDIRFHEAQKAQDLGVALVDVTHYASEVLIVPVIARYLREKTALDVVESHVDGQVFDVI